MSNLSNIYKIHSGNFFYEPNRNLNSLHRNYYYPNNPSNNKIYNYSHYSSYKKDKNFFNSRSKGSNNNFFMNELNDINNFDLSHKNINFNPKSDQKIKLTYEFENISPNEISYKTKELINLQSQMCNLDSKNNNNNSDKKHKNKIKNKRLSQSHKNIRANFLSGLTTYKTRSVNKNFKRNQTFNELPKNNNKLLFSLKDNKSRIIKKTKSLKKNMDKIWKDKCDELDEEISDTKNKIKKLKIDNSMLNKRINYVKEKEDKKYLIYDKNFKIKIFNHKLLEKLKLSEEIKKKQIELIIRMQKEVNNMRLKLHMLGECCD